MALIKQFKFKNANHFFKMLIFTITGVLLDENDREIGVKTVGKDTVGQMICDKLQKTHIVRTIALADPLKDIICKHFGLARNIVDTPECKEKPIPHVQNKSFRFCLEKYGTEVIRNLNARIPDLRVDCSEIWINKLKYNIKRLNLTPLQTMVAATFDLTNAEIFDQDSSRLGVSFDQLCSTIEDSLQHEEINLMKIERQNAVIITDVRFYNEYLALKSLGCKFIQVRRRISGGTDIDVTKSHDSNKVDHRMIPDYVIENHGTLDELSQIVSQIV